MHEALACIAAHEIGHGLGVLHTHTYTPGSIMNTVGILTPRGAGASRVRTDVPHPIVSKRAAPGSRFSPGRITADEGLGSSQGWWPREGDAMSYRSAPRILLLALFFALGACGGGGGGAPTPPAVPAALTITTLSLPGGSVGTPINCPPLSADNVAGSATWDVTTGALPDGLTLASNGTITGTPTRDGSFPFVVRVRDAQAEDTQPLSISIGALALEVSAGLVHGDAWSGKPLTLTTSGGSGSVTFTVEANGSGGSFSAIDEANGTATWTPGPTAGLSVRDTLRATNTSTGQHADVDIDVMPDPTENFTASFGSTDVWWIDAGQKFGTHPFATDLHKALADLGLRAPGSTGATGSEADELAHLWMRVELLRQVNMLFLRQADGASGAAGLAISFPFVEPGAGYTKPATGSWFSGSPTRFSQMGITNGTLSGVIGTAWMDGTGNGRCENDTNAGEDELGVFPNQITPIFNSSFGTPLVGDPVGADDLEALRALLYGLPNPGGRYSQLSYIGRGFARTLATVVAHEIGHSLGLDHTIPEQAGSIMNPAARIGPSSAEAFTAEDILQLQSALPGAGRSSGALTAAKTDGLPEGGIVVCRRRAVPAGR